MNTVNRGTLLKLAKTGKLSMTESYHFDDMRGSERHMGASIPVAIMPEDRSQRVAGTAYLFESDFKTKSGRAWRNPDGTITLIVHGNCNYTLAVAA